MVSGHALLATATLTAVFTITGQAAQAQDSGVIASASFDVTSDEYLQWNAETCVFEPAEGPAGYVAEVRRVEEPVHVVFTPEEQTNAVFVAEANRLVELGEEAGVEVTVLDNAFPDTMRPLQNADQAVTMGVDVVLSQLILPDLNPAVQTKYKEGCIPMVNVFGMPNYPFPAPTIQAIHKENGIVMAGAAIELIHEKGWDPEEMWIVSCGDPQTAAGPGTAEDLMVGFAETVAAEFGIPDERISDILVCSQADGPLGSKTAVTDWLTAHPDATYVVGSAWNDVKAFGMAQALEQAGYTADTALTAGRDANVEHIEAMRAGSVLQVNLDLDLVEGWAVAMLAIAQDIAAGRPVPAINVPAATPIVPSDL